MLVPDEVRKCVAFIGYRSSEGNALAGTVFFVGTDLPETGGRIAVYGVTAKHVVDQVARNSVDGKVYLRLNFLDGSAKFVPTDLLDWRFHPTEERVDVAAIPLGGFAEEMDHLVYPATSFATSEVIQREGIGIGEEVFLVGLFYGHVGKQRNTPIIRVGNIAALPEEPVNTSSFGAVDAYLIEARSIGGLSGSPVFVNLGLVRHQNGQIRFARTATGTGIFYLLGLIHGHWDSPVPGRDTIVNDVLGEETVNMGIAIVVPAGKILEVINQPQFQELREKIILEIKLRHSTNGNDGIS